MDLLMTNYPNQTMIDLSNNFESECSFCNGGAPDDDFHYLICPGVTYHKQIHTFISRICKNQFLREGLQTLGTSIKRLLR
eukprot:UN10629